MSAKYSGIDGYVGNTPLIRLRRLSELTGCEILGKAEFMRLTESRNPRVQYFDWVVPNAPTTTAVLNIRFGCLNIFPETPSIQLQSVFVISPAVND